jgi:hypothetical protein
MYKNIKLLYTYNILPPPFHSILPLSFHQKTLLCKISQSHHIAASSHVNSCLTSIRTAIANSRWLVEEYCSRGKIMPTHHHHHYPNKSHKILIGTLATAEIEVGFTSSLSIVIAFTSTSSFISILASCQTFIMSADVKSL